MTNNDPGGARAQLDLAALVEEFETGRVQSSFHHADHLRVAYAYVAKYPFLEAISRFSSALKRVAEARGNPRLYHETVTWAYLLLIRERVARAGRVQGDLEPWEEFAVRNPDLLIWKDGILATLYLPETLDSELARNVFVLPDRSR
jgi:hypothetical protein